MAEPLHIAFFNRSFYPDTGATGQLLMELAEGLVRDHGCRVSVVTGVHGAAARGLVTRERYRGIDIVRARGTRVPKTRFIGRFANYVTYFLSACWAGLWLDRPDVVVALTDPPIIGLAAYLASRRFRVPFVMSYRDIFPEVARLLEDFRSETVYGVLNRVTRFLARTADRSVALGETMRTRLIEEKGADPAATVVIPDWADRDEITPAGKDNPFARAQGLAGKFVVMHSGNIGLSQDLDILLEAALRLRRCADLDVVFIGEGVKKAALRQRAEALGLGNVRFLPYQPREDLRDVFATADVFVVSLRRGLAGYIVPSKLYGILAAGRPYVAAVEDTTETAAITRHYDCGLVVDPGDSAALADRIAALYENRDLAVRLGANARRASAAFDRRTQVRAYYNLFRTLARRPLPASPSRESDIVSMRTGT